jgi:hypothetical protein
VGHTIVRTPTASYHYGNNTALPSLAIAKELGKQKLRAEADRLAKKAADLGRIARSL